MVSVAVVVGSDCNTDSTCKDGIGLSKWHLSNVGPQMQSLHTHKQTNQNQTAQNYPFSPKGYMD
ncbi:hypothetical protein DYY65_05385 [Nitrososphaera sp. AFS]|nr:hypothetical protein [Nitrososphaera sp. AFS]